MSVAKTIFIKRQNPGVKYNLSTYKKGTDLKKPVPFFQLYSENTISI